ncbi:AraC family transcriptional regulator [Gordonia sp. DT218]|uniref:AraC family transcriptional regulator n=1 Tax=Gordonia sp. DT218 TaxID=3416659 RepID=UPI003CF42F7F
MSVIRGTGLTGYPELVRDLGADPEPLLLGAGVSPRDVARFDTFIPYLALIQAVESAAAVTRTPDFGRRLAAEWQGIEILGPVGVAARTTGTVADALATFEQYLYAYSPAISVVIRDEGEISVVEFSIVIPHHPPAPQTIEMSLGVALRIVRFLLGSRYSPTAVYLPHPAQSPPVEYAKYFSCAPHFGDTRAGIAVRSADLARPILQDAMAHQIVLEYLDTVVDRQRPGTASSIRELVRQLLPTGGATITVVAEQFRLHPKTLQRRLAVEGVNFNAVVADVRRELAQRYLRDTDMTLSHLARELGYAEQSVLTRSCRRWFGASPATLRKVWRSAESGIASPSP